MWEISCSLQRTAGESTGVLSGRASKGLYWNPEEFGSLNVSIPSSSWCLFLADGGTSSD